MPLLCWEVRRASAWLDVSGSGRPRTGQTRWCPLPTVSVEAVTLALADFTRDESVDTDHRAVLVVDQAGWHTSPKVN